MTIPTPASFGNEPYPMDVNRIAKTALHGGEPSAGPSFEPQLNCERLRHGTLPRHPEISLVWRKLAELSRAEADPNRIQERRLPGVVRADQDSRLVGRQIENEVLNPPKVLDRDNRNVEVGHHKVTSIDLAYHAF